MKKWILLSPRLTQNFTSNGITYSQEIRLAMFQDNQQNMDISGEYDILYDQDYVDSLRKQLEESKEQFMQATIDLRIT